MVTEFIKTIEAAKKTKLYPEYYSKNNIDINKIKTLSNINRLKFITKEVIKNYYNEMINPELSDKKLYMTTGGTTGIQS